MHNMGSGQASFREERFSLSWGSLSALRLQRAKQTQILALHGWLDNAASFVPLMNCASSGDWLALELAGHGHSDARGADNFGHFLDHVVDLLAVARELPGPINLIGHSMGGGIGMLFAAAFPEHVRALVLIDALGPLSHGEFQYPAALRSGAEARLAFRDKRRSYPSLEPLVQARVQAGGISEASARLLTERGVEHLPSGIRFRTDPRHLLPSTQRSSEAQILAAIGALQCSTLAILAEPRTAFLSGERMEKRMAAWPRLKLAHLKGSHHLHMESAEAVWPLIEAFLSE
jgi:pimeloyl-ACP methyl ester carboxylesterase